MDMNSFYFLIYIYFSTFTGWKTIDFHNFSESMLVDFPHDSPIPSATGNSHFFILLKVLSRRYCLNTKVVWRILKQIQE